MNLEEIEIPLSIKALYKILGEERIMAYYFKEEVNLRKKYRNPFRKDSQPGCCFRWTTTGNLYFVDYAMADGYYSPLDIAMLATGYSYPDILTKIESDFNLINLKFEDKNKLVLEAEVIEPPEVIPADIKVRIMPFTDKDLAYWGQFGISRSILEYYNIKRIDRAWINNVMWYMNDDNDPCYRYKEKDKFKLYRPLGNKKVKFRSSLYGGILEGYTQLPLRGTKLVITKGLKDVMTLHSAGINAVAVRSENTPISENAYEILKSRFDKLYLWFDADDAGINGARKMSERYNIPFLQHDASLGKDPSDIYRDHGKEKFIQLCKLLMII